jgi:hypothetical protein
VVFLVLVVAFSLVGFELVVPISFLIDDFATLAFLGAGCSSSLNSDSASDSSSASELVINTASAAFFFPLAGALALGAALGLSAGLGFEAVAVAFLDEAGVAKAVEGEEAALLERVVRLVEGSEADGDAAEVDLRFVGCEVRERSGGRAGGKSMMANPRRGTSAG